jgi:hypothetical protein
MATRRALEELVHDFELVEDLAGRVPEEVVDRLRSMIEGDVRAARQSSVPGLGGRSRKLIEFGRLVIIGRIPYVVCDRRHRCDVAQLEAGRSVLSRLALMSLIRR